MFRFLNTPTLRNLPENFVGNFMSPIDGSRLYFGDFVNQLTPEGCAYVPINPKRAEIQTIADGGCRLSVIAALNRFRNLVIQFNNGDLDSVEIEETK